MTLKKCGGGIKSISTQLYIQCLCRPIGPTYCNNLFVQRRPTYHIVIFSTEMATSSQKSIIHTEFETTDDSDTCNTCKKSLKRQKSAATRQLWNHLKRFHPTKYDDLKNQQASKVPKKETVKVKSSPPRRSPFHVFYLVQSPFLYGS